MREKNEFTTAKLFWVFAKMSLLGFGGVASWAYLTLVEQLKWLSAEEYAELLGLGQILPGANIVNLSAMFGYRKLGLKGALSALLGLIFFPFLVVLALGVLYDRYGQLNLVQGMLHGMSAAAAGLVFYTGVKLARGLPNPVRSSVYLVATIVAIYFQYPLPVVVVGVGGIAALIEWRCL